MKRAISAMFCLLVQLCLAQRYVPTTATIIVRDDMGMPAVNIEIEGGFRDVSNAGSRDRFKGVTDTNGVLIAKGKALVGVGVRATGAGYYQTVTSAPIDRQQALTMEHWNVTVPVVLKRMRNPIPMYVAAVENRHIAAVVGVGKYNLGKTVSYDFLRRDFLPPEGQGLLGDIEFKWAMAIYSTNKVGRAIDYDTRCEIRMTNGMDGLCRGKPDGDFSGGEGSAYIAAYEAPMDGYTNAVVYYDHVRGRKAESNDDRHYLYYFRIRTQTNEFGQVTNALYGKIHGQINGHFSYYLNPTPNDRNVEFAPGNNLFKKQ